MNNSDEPYVRVVRSSYNEKKIKMNDGIHMYEIHIVPTEFFYFEQDGVGHWKHRGDPYYRFFADPLWELISKYEHEEIDFPRLSNELFYLWLEFSWELDAVEGIWD